MDSKQTAREKLSAIRNRLIEISHSIHRQPELAFHEEKASTVLSEELTRAGFAVEKGLCQIPTAFIGKIGKGSLHIAICAEYDALPGIGHACGHNIIAAAGIGAGIALSELVDELDLTINVFGTPAEENGGGKVLLLERGAFKDIHAAMMVHPGSVDLIEPAMIAAGTFDIHFYGKEAHASAFPEQGINAADALTIAQTAIGLLRQHIHPTDRIHGIITKGGDAANVIPSHTEAKYIIRSQTIDELTILRKKVLRCFEAGALATGATLKVIENEKPYAQVIHDHDLAAYYKSNAEQLGRAFLDSLNDNKSQPLSWKNKFFLYLLKQVGISSKDLKPILGKFTASTDMGNVSLVIPSIHPTIGIDAGKAVPHQPEFTARCNTPSADQAVFDGALAMAWTIIDIASDAKLKKRLLKKI